MGAVVVLRPSQELAADFAFERDRTLILGRVGSGKTAAALTAMQAYKDEGLVKRWLVLGTKRICTDVWPQEAKKWSKLSVKAAVGTPNQRLIAFREQSDVVAINYDNLQWLATKFPDLAKRFDGVVFDELTKLKSPSGKRFKAFLPLLDGIRVRIGLTGSFTSNGLEDVFGQCKVVDQTLLGRSKGAFMQQYFWCANPQFGEWIPRPNALQQVMDKIKPATFMLDNESYVASLPPLHIVPVKCSFASRQYYDKMRKDFVIDYPDAKAIAANSGAVTQKLLQMASGFVYETTTTPSDTPGKFKTTKTSHWFSSHKFDALHEVLEENQHANTIIFYNFEEELAELKRRYPYAETIDASNVVQRWNDGKVRLLVAHPASAGHGLNLQFGGSNMIFTSLPWSLELWEQAIGRLHRSGQTQPVYVYCMLTSNTVDEIVFQALQDKQTLSEIAVEALK